ncbi:MAG: hypothetical protein CMJ78_06500 [Planctomycetaceae bacterium]|nr:hypothetical protein [Planctomycetaceae bacterium]
MPTPLKGHQKSPITSLRWPIQRPEQLKAPASLNRRPGDDQALDASQVWVAPGDFHMLVRREANSVRNQGLIASSEWKSVGDAEYQFIPETITRSVRVQLSQAPPENECRPAADVLFRSAANVFGPGTLGVVLTGMGMDAVAGCRAIVEVGGRVLVQDEASSAVWGMPGQVARAGLAEAILPPDELAQTIARRLMKD